MSAFDFLPGTLQEIAELIDGVDKITKTLF